MKSVLLVLGCVLIFGCKKIEDPIVGKWKTGDDFSGFLHLEEIGCEIEFRANGTYSRLSDDGMNIQVRNNGKYLLNEGEVAFEGSGTPWPIIMGYWVKGNTLNLYRNGDFIKLVRSDEPHEGLAALPRQPESLEEATSLLIEEMSKKDRHYVAMRSENDLIMFHMGWGTGIRNRFGLWSGNTKLLSSCGHRWMHPDGASSVIIHSVWKRLREEMDPSLLSQIEEVQEAAKMVEVPVSNLLAQRFEVGLGEVQRAVVEAEKSGLIDEAFEIDCSGLKDWREWGPLGIHHDEELLSVEELLSRAAFQFRVDLLYEPGRIVFVGD